MKKVQTRARNGATANTQAPSPAPTQQRDALTLADDYAKIHGMNVGEFVNLLARYKKELREAPETVSFELPRKLWLRAKIASMSTGQTLEEFTIKALEAQMKTKIPEGTQVVC